MQAVKSILRRVKHRWAHSQNTKLRDALSLLPHLKNDGVTLIDVGAAGDIEPRWKRVSPLLNYVGFEPDERSRRELLSKPHTCRSYNILGEAVWNEPGQLTLNLCRKPKVSSHFQPDRQLLDLFPESDRFDVMQVAKLNTTTLDALQIKSSPDFIKLDIQGGELAALEGAEKTLTQTLGIEVEVEFLPLYRDQPLFGDLCRYLAKFGLQFIDFVSLNRWERHAYTGYGQCMFGDALFMRTPESILDISRKQGSTSIVSRYLAVAVIYNRFDLVDQTFKLFDAKERGEFSASMTALFPLRRNDRLARNINTWTSAITNTLGSPYRTHLFY